MKVRFWGMKFAKLGCVGHKEGERENREDVVLEGVDVVRHFGLLTLRFMISTMKRKMKQTKK